MNFGIDLTILNHWWQQEFRDQVVRQAIDAREVIDGEIIKKFEEVIRRNVKIKGFRPNSVTSAPPAILARSVSNNIENGEELLEAVLKVWATDNSELLQAINTFLDEHNLPVREPDEISQPFKKMWLIDELSNLTDEFTTQWEETDHQAAALMLCLISGNAPVSPEIFDEINETMEKALQENIDSDDEVLDQVELIWEPWLDQLEGLEPEASEWQKYQEFIKAIEELAQKKLKALEKDQKELEKLAAALDNLRNETGDLLVYFDLANEVTTWLPQDWQEDKRNFVTNRILAFKDRLLEYKDIRDRVTKNFTEEKRKQGELRIKGDEVFEIYDELHDYMGIEGELEQYPESTDQESSEIDEENELVESENTIESDLTRDIPEPDAEKATKPELSILEDESDEETNSDDLKQKIDIDESLPESLQNEQVVPVETAQVETVSGAGITVQEDEGRVSLEGTELDREMHSASTENAASIERSVKAGFEHVEFSTSKIAQSLETETTPEGWEKLFWSMIAEDDLAGAYWLTRSMTVQGEKEPLPIWLVQAVQGSRWLMPDSSMFVSDLLGITEDHLPEGSIEAEILGLAAALRPALIAPYSGLIGWLRTPTALPQLSDLVNAVNDFASTGIALSPVDIFGVSGEAQREAQLEEIVRMAESWLEQAFLRKTKFKRATDVWRYLIGQKGEVRAMLKVVSSNKQDEYDSVGEQIKKWRSREFAIAQIEAIDHQLYKLKTRTIEGDAREQLLRYIFEACDLAEKWCTLVHHEKELQSRGNWIFEQVANLREYTIASIPDALSTLQEMDTETQPVHIRSASRSMIRSIYQLADTLQLEFLEGAEPPIGKSRWDWLARSADTIPAGLQRRLLILPEIDLSEEIEPKEEELPEIAEALRKSLAEARTVPQAIETWIQVQDYRFVETLLDVVDDPQISGVLRLQATEMRDGSRLALNQNISETEQVIEQAVVDGIINEERAQFSTEVEAITPENIMNFQAVFKRLEEIRTAIQIARRHRLSHLQNRWNDYQKKVETSHLVDDQKEQVIQRVTSALQAEDTRLVEEYLSNLQEVLDSTSDLAGIWFQDDQKQDILVEFNSSYDRIDRWMGDNRNSLRNIANEVESGRMIGGLNFNVPAKRREEAVRAIQSWLHLKKNSSGDPHNPQHLKDILRYLGFTLNAGKEPVEIKKAEGELLYARIDMSAGDLARPIPQLGSLARGKYNVICLWERPGAEMISSRLRVLQLKLDTVIVLYLGRLTNKQRQDITRISREQELAITLLDEILLLFLAQERDARLPAFLKCTLPYSAISPYTPFQAGDVPPEMFFGREAMARDLQRPQGTSLVYGGRQLGKSALLRHIAREFHNPERQKYACVEDIKLIGDPSAGQSTDALWRRLRDILKDFQLISDRVITDKPEEIRRYIRELLQGRRDLQILILFDEADNFLDADARDNFKVTEPLRVLMSESERRFKVVFAGLHNVQRFQGLSNQPLAHFGNPIQVGPLEAESALQLITKPLEFLGFRFSDQAGPLRILSYTNYHPGLIQLFCQELLNYMRSVNSAHLPPFAIEQGNIESVYRKLREHIRERFDWTLALDKRYQAIAWALIEDQIEMRDSYVKIYSPTEILNLVRGWWAKGFNNVQLDEMRGFLDEMEGLGVLQRDNNGQYRLRSPNLVRLMGTTSDVETMLLELSEKEPEISFEADSHFAPNDERAKRYSPFTYAQERLLNARRIGVGLVFASTALGWDCMEDAIHKYLPVGEVIAGSWQEIPLYINSGEDLIAYLQGFINKYPDVEQSVLYYRPSRTSPEELRSLVSGGLEFCQRRQSKRKVLRLLFLLDTEATWEWLKLPVPSRDALEMSADAVLSPKKWTEVGIKQRLSQKNKLDSPKVCRAVIESTGGWPFLLDRLFDASGRADDPREQAQSMKKELSKASELREQFLQALGVMDKKPATLVLDYLLQLNSDQIPMDFVSSELIGSQAPLTQAEYDQALEFLIHLRLIDRDAENICIDPIVKSVMGK